MTSLVILFNFQWARVVIFLNDIFLNKAALLASYLRQCEVSIELGLPILIIFWNHRCNTSLLVVLTRKASELVDNGLFVLGLMNKYWQGGLIVLFRYSFKVLTGHRGDMVWFPLGSVLNSLGRIIGSSLLSYTSCFLRSIRFPCSETDPSGRKNKSSGSLERLVSSDILHPVASCNRNANFEVSELRLSGHGS